ncbi:MAG TPA: DUF5666 domain-containing protein [Thermoanaerobaculia bacterium]|nr:DUF5666 domain-containing protein [Thermoanaerobaculia bacterium]
MTQNHVSTQRSLIMTILMAFAAVSLFAQTGTRWRTGDEIREGVSGTITGAVERIDSNGFTLDPDSEVSTPSVRVEGTASTRYSGLGVRSQDIWTGRSGLGQLKIGDRVEVQGTGRAGGVIRAVEVALVGRAVGGLLGTTSGIRTADELEGTIRDIRILDSSFILESEDGVRTTIVGTAQTPVIFEGRTYSIRNLEEGDGVRVEVDARLSSGEIRARRIHVLKDSTPDEPTGVRSENYVTGRVSKLDRGNSFTLRADRAGEIRIDTSRAADRAGDSFRVNTLQVGDRLRIWGAYTSPRVFRAERIEFGSAGDAYQDDEYQDQGQQPFTGYSTVVFYGRIDSNPANEDKITLRDRDGDRKIEIVVDEEFVVQREDGIIRASQLRKGDSVVIKAFRDPRGNYVAQTIRLQ